MYSRSGSVMCRDAGRRLHDARPQSVAFRILAAHGIGGRPAVSGAACVPRSPAAPTTNDGPGDTNERGTAHKAQILG